MKNIDYTQNCIDLTDVESEKELIDILTSAEFKNRINDMRLGYCYCPCRINTVDREYGDIQLNVNITNAWTERQGTFLLISVIDIENNLHKVFYYNESEGRFKPDNGDYLKEEFWPENWDYDKYSHE